MQVNIVSISMYEIHRQKTTINTCEIKGNAEYRSKILHGQHNREYSLELWSRSPLQHKCYSNRAKGQQQSSELGTVKAGLQKQAREPKSSSSHLHLKLSTIPHHT